jgi:signal transduction histidine kinase
MPIAMSSDTKRPVRKPAVPLIAVSLARERGAFLSLAAHDLRTPLSALKLLIEATRQQIKPGDGKRPVDALSSSALSMRLDSMMKQTDEIAWQVHCLASVSLIESNLVDVPPENVDLADLASAAIARLAEPARFTHCEIVLRSSGAVRGRWRRSLLEDAIFNVFRNSIKSGANRSVEVRVEADEANAWISVEDHGLEISEAAPTPIFERTLGLWTAREIMRALGGSIRIAGRPAGGTILTITAPRLSSEYNCDPNSHTV